MRAVVQRVKRAEVRVAGDTIGAIDLGLVVLLGIANGDREEEAAVMAAKIAGLRIFSDDQGRMNLDLGDVAGRVLLVSQFTLLADVAKGRRPSFVAAAEPDRAAVLVESVARRLRAAGIAVDAGLFGAAMEVELVNDGPVTIVIDVADGRMARH